MNKEKRDYQEPQELPENREMKETQVQPELSEGHEIPEPSEDRKPQEQQEQPMPKTELWAEGFNNLKNISWNAPVIRMAIAMGILMRYYVSFQRPGLAVEKIVDYLTWIMIGITFVAVRLDPVNKEAFKNGYTKKILLAIIIVPIVGIYFWRFLLSN